MEKVNAYISQDPWEAGTETGAAEAYWDKFVRGKKRERAGLGGDRLRPCWGSDRASANATGSSRVKTVHYGSASIGLSDECLLTGGAGLILPSEGGLKVPNN